MLQRQLPDKEYYKTLQLLNELDKGNQQEGLVSCLAFSKRGEVVWFDEVGSPWGVEIQGAALVRTRLLSLPSQPMRVVGVEEAYRQLIQMRERQYLTVLATLTFGKTNRKTRKIMMLVSMLLGIVLVYIVFKPFSTAFDNGLVAGVGDVRIVSTGNYYPIGDPTISRTTFRDFLREMNSPALPEADKMFDACLQEGCDPALALAFFEHESSGGKEGVAVNTRSIGNIRCTPGYECYNTEGNGSFRKYKTWTDSVKDWARLLKEYRDNGLRTLEQIIPVYAPSEDNNDPDAYIRGVKQRVNDLRSRELNLHKS
jgi:hypothetical protein